jgi:parallel beta-helix repeat protein
VDSRVESSVLENNLFCGAVLYENAERDTVANCTVTGNVYGILLSGGSDDCTVSSSRVEENECGLYLVDSDGATVTRNVVANSTDAGLLLHLSGGGTIYDNRFENNRNAGFTGEPVEANAWSVAPRAGPNVVGCPQVGGNYWARPDGRGFSEVTADENGDGFADGVLALAAGNADEHPLAPSVGYAPIPETTPTPEPTETSVPWIPTPVPLTTAATSVPVPVVPGGAGAPTDTDGDGLYDDVNGNGRQDFSDVVLYFSRMTWIAANEPVAGFDYNRNGRIDFADVVALFASV